MKKTIASLAILASTSSAMALIGPDFGGPRPELKSYCLKTYKESDYSKSIDCDATQLNQRAVEEGAQVKKNGCLKGQVALVTSVELPISKCMPPGVVEH
jgi:hypothetical protein